MENKNIEGKKQNTGTEDQKSKKKTRVLTDPYRVGIGEEAHLLVEEIVSRCNEGFTAGEVTRSDVANFLILERGKIVGEGDIKVLRSLHFDERKMLYALLHQSGRSGELPEEVRRALRSINGVNEQAKKRPSKTHKEAPQEQFPEASEVK